MKERTFYVAATPLGPFNFFKFFALMPLGVLSALIVAPMSIQFWAMTEKGSINDELTTAIGGTAGTIELIDNIEGWKLLS